jgi:hypothetical protein
MKKLTLVALFTTARCPPGRVARPASLDGADVPRPMD